MANSYDLRSDSDRRRQEIAPETIDQQVAKQRRPSEEEKRYLRFRDLQARGIVANWVTLGRWIKQGRFPKPVQLGPNMTAWLSEEVAEWEQSLLRERDGNERTFNVGSPKFQGDGGMTATSRKVV